MPVIVRVPWWLKKEWVKPLAVHLVPLSKLLPNLEVRGAFRGAGPGARPHVHQMSSIAKASLLTGQCPELAQQRTVLNCELTVHDASV